MGFARVSLNLILVGVLLIASIFLNSTNTVKALSSVKGPKFGQCRVYLQKELSTRKSAVTNEC